MKFLSPVDATFMRMETARTPMNIGILAIFRLPPEAPRTWLQDLFAHMRSLPATTPPFCYRLAHSPRTRLAPAWEIAPSIDIDYHLRHSCLPYPGGERELGVLVARLHSNAMDTTRPLWECHLIEGMERGRFGVYLKAHHALLDGMGILSAIMGWLSADPTIANAPGPWAIVPNADPADMIEPPRLTMRTAVAQAGHALRAANELQHTLTRMTRRKDNPYGGMYSVLSTPKTLFNRQITHQRRLATQRFKLSRLKALSRATNSTVNDLCLAIAGGAIRRYLMELGALPTASVIASVPVGLARQDGKPGNSVAGFVLPLSTQIDDSLARLRSITAITGRTKEQMRSMSPSALEQLTLLGLTPIILGQWTGLSQKIPSLFNVIVSNVVASRVKLYLQGAELEAAYPASVLFDSYALNITIVGYADHVCVGITGCRDAVPHVQRLAVYCGEMLDEMERAAGLPPPSAEP